MIDYLFGDGVPSSITPNRVEKILGFARSQKRAFEDALDRAEGPICAQTRKDCGLYERIHVLLQTDAGRLIYSNARQRFEKKLPKRFGRADFFTRLKRDCIQSIFDETFSPTIKKKSNAAAVKSDASHAALAQDRQWLHIAEYIWAQCATSQFENNVATTTVEHLQLSQLLSNLNVIPISQNAKLNEIGDKFSKEELGEVERLIKLVSDAVALLEPDNLDTTILTGLGEKVNRLVVVAEMRHACTERINELNERITNWQNQNSNELSNNPELETRIASLESIIGNSDIPIIQLNSILEKLQACVADTMRIHAEKDRAHLAIDGLDHDLVAQISGELKSLELKRSMLLDEIDTEIANLGSSASATQVSEKVGEEDQLSESHDSPDRAAETPNIELKDVSKVGAPDSGTYLHYGSKGEPTAALEAHKENIRSQLPERDGGPDDSDSELEGKVRGALAKEVSSGRYAIAFHIAKAFPKADLTHNMVQLIASNYVGRDVHSVVSSFPTLASEVRDDLQAIVKNHPSRKLTPGTAALVACAALTPARSSTGGPVAQLLRDLQAHLKDQVSLCNMVTTAAEVSERGIPVHFVAGLNDDSEKHWHNKVKNLRNETDVWLEAARRATFRYKPAKDVWRKILEERDGGEYTPLGYILLKFKSSSPSSTKMERGIDVNKFASCVDMWKKNLDREIDKMDRKCRTTTKFKNIDGPARTDLHTKINEALSLIEKWLKVFEFIPTTSSDYYSKCIEDLRAVVRQQHTYARDEIANLTSGYESRTLALFDQYISFFGYGNGQWTLSDLGILDLLNGELLADENVEFDEETGKPRAEVPLLEMLALSEQPKIDFAKSAISRAERHDFSSAARSVEFAFHKGLLSERQMDRVSRAIDDQWNNSIELLERRVDSVLNRLGSAYARGVVSTEEFEKLRAEVPPRNSISQGSLLNQLRSIEAIDRKLNNNELNRRVQLQARIDKITTLTSADKARIDAALSAKRFFVVEDFLDYVARGKSLPNPRPTRRRPFDYFFPRFVQEYDKYRRDCDKPLKKVKEVFASKGCWGPVDVTKLSNDEARNGSELVNIWRRLFETRREKVVLESLFASLQFVDPTIALHRPEHLEAHIRRPGFDVARLRTRVISDRTIAQLPEFGSRAEGKYRVILVRNVFTSDAVVRSVGALEHDERSPIMVICPDHLSIESRQSLAYNFARGSFGSPLVLDETLLVFLAMTSESERLSAFFDCASAFSFASPYNPDSAYVPPEMFYGRVAARRRIMSHDDESHFVFGGRRLGKTALLKNIEAELSVRSPSRVTVYLDLTGKDLQNPESIWKHLASVLAKRVVTLKGTRRGDTIRDRIKSWIAESPDRYVLLLFDEADDFLEADRRECNYRVLREFRDLMSQTNHRLKVVFTGLHNVQRASRSANTPLARLGQPIQIGPMFPDLDPQDGPVIENLIRQPLEALGFRFARPDDVTHIAMETNYYPALAQQFCKELLRHLRESAVLSRVEGPPYIIPTETIQAVFYAKETRDRLQNIFSWTIQLDPRYVYLTYLIALQGVIDDAARASGVSLTEIREIALSEWPQGFASDPSYWVFELLLEEMTGLGVLREISATDLAERTNFRSNAPFIDHASNTTERRFAIRTHSLQLLLGNDAEIERRYEDSKRNETKRHNPSMFRRSICEFELSPLSAAQEQLLLFDPLHVGLVFGTKLSGVDLVVEAIKQTANEIEMTPSIEVLPWNSLLKRLQVIGRKKGTDDRALIIDFRDAWDFDLIVQATELVGKLYLSEKQIRVIFLSDPIGAWNWLNETDSTNVIGLRATWLSPCSIDFAQLWLRDKIAAFSDLQDYNDVKFVPWPTVVSCAAKSKHTCLKDAATEIVNTRRRVVDDVLDVSGVRPVLETLFEFSPSPLSAEEIHSWVIESTKELESQTEQFLSFDKLLAIVDWAMRLGVVNKDGDKYTLDSIYSIGINTG